MSQKQGLKILVSLTTTELMHKQLVNYG